VRSRNRTDLD